MKTLLYNAKQLKIVNTTNKTFLDLADDNCLRDLLIKVLSIGHDLSSDKSEEKIEDNNNLLDMLSEMEK